VDASLFAEALGRGRALLAPKSNLGDDLPAASCLRFGSEKELSYRMAFLARNPDVCRMMATNGWRHLVDTRSPQAIGRYYDEV